MHHPDECFMLSRTRMESSRTVTLSWLDTSVMDFKLLHLDALTWRLDSSCSRRVGWSVFITSTVYTLACHVIKQQNLNGSENIRRKELFTVLNFMLTIWFWWWICWVLDLLFSFNWMSCWAFALIGCWRSLLKPRFEKRVGDLQWRVVHAIGATNRYLVHFNPGTGDGCPFCYWNCGTSFSAFGCLTGLFSPF